MGHIKNNIIFLLLLFTLIGCSEADICIPATNESAQKPGFVSVVNSVSVNPQQEGWVYSNINLPSGKSTFTLSGQITLAQRYGDQQCSQTNYNLSPPQNLCTSSDSKYECSSNNQSNCYSNDRKQTYINNGFGVPIYVSALLNKPIDPFRACGFKPDVGNILVFSVVPYSVNQNSYYKYGNGSNRNLCGTSSSSDSGCLHVNGDGLFMQYCSDQGKSCNAQELTETIDKNNICSEYNTSCNLVKNYLHSSAQGSAATVSALNNFEASCSTAIPESSGYNGATLLINDKNTDVNLYFKGDENNSMEGGYYVYVKALPAVYPSLITRDTKLRGCIEPSLSSNPKCESSFAITDGLNQNLSSSGYLYIKVDDDGRYDNNTGLYNLDVESSFPDTSGIANMIQEIINLVKTQVMKFSKIIFENFTCVNSEESLGCSGYNKIITTLLTLYIIIFAISYLFGLVKLSHGDIVIRCLKIGLVITLIRDQSWQFFNDYLFNAIVNGGSDLINMARGQENLVNPNVFGFIEKTTKIFFSPINLLKIFAFMFTGLSGFVLAILLYYSVYVFAKAILNCVKIYCLSFAFIGILIALAPIFLPFMLFHITAKLAEKWFRLLIRYMLEPVIIIIGVIVINDLIYVIAKNLFAFSICWKCAIPVKIGFNVISTFFHTNTLFCIPGLLPWGIDNLGGGMDLYSSNGITPVIVHIPKLIGLILIIKLMESYVSSIGSHITSFLTETHGLTVSLTQAVGVKDLISRGEHHQGNESGGLLSGTGGTGFLSKVLGIDKESVQRRQYARDITEKVKGRIVSNENPMVFKNRWDAYNLAEDIQKKYSECNKMLEFSQLEKDYMQITKQVEMDFKKHGNQIKDPPSANDTPDLAQAKQRHQLYKQLKKDVEKDLTDRANKAQTNTQDVQNGIGKLTYQGKDVYDGNRALLEADSGKIGAMFGRVTNKDNIVHEMKKISKDVAKVTPELTRRLNTVKQKNAWD